MVAVKLEAFGGMLPAVSRRLLPNTAAAYAANTDLTTGEMRAIRQPAALHTFPANVKKAFRIPNPGTAEGVVWKGCLSANANLVRSPLVNDSFRRQIWIDENGPGAPQRLLQNTLDRIISGAAPFLLGVPIPDLAPGLVVTGGSGLVETRSYLYTFSNQFGEEGQPSPPGTASGFLTGTWTLSGLAAPADAAARGLTHINLYRTITAAAGAGTTFYRVAQLDISATSYADTRASSDVAGESLILASTPWREPEALEGFVQMPNGILAGWKGNKVFFSEPYRPWAWPAEYILAVRYEIMGCAVIDQTLVVLTTGAPSFITGTTPASMTIADSPAAEPCLSAHAITAGPDGVYYISRNGLMVINAGGITNTTEALIEPRDWRANYATNVLGIGRFESKMLVFQTVGGYVIDGRDTRVALQRLKGFAPVDNVWTDPYTGETHIAAANRVYLWGSIDAAYATALWRSKEYHLPKPVNLGAALLSIDSSYDADLVTGPVLEPLPPLPTGGPWDYLASTIGYSRVFGATLGVGPAPGDIAPGNPPTTAPWPFWPGVIAYGSSFDAEESLHLPDGALCVLNVYADRQQVWSQAVESGTTYRLPSGFKSDLWQFSILSRVPVYSLQVAETAKDLASV